MAGQIILSPGQLLALLDEFEQRGDTAALNDFVEAAKAEGRERTASARTETPSQTSSHRPTRSASRALLPAMIKQASQSSI